VLSVREECVSKHVQADPVMNVLEQDWVNIKPVFPVASGGLQPAMIPSLLSIFGNDVIMQFGGGIHAHPKGTRAGAMACRQSLDAALEGKTLSEAAKTKKELRTAIAKWGLRIRGGGGE
jgi:ribulose-bisphosphate carboxylase large chain